MTNSGFLHGATAALALALVSPSCGGQSNGTAGSDASSPDPADAAVSPSEDAAAPWQYGDNGSYTAVEETFANPQWPAAGGDALDVHIFLPDGRQTPAPALFFSHAYGASDPGIYQDLIEHLVSHGFAVVFSPYPTLLSGPTVTTGQATRYKTLWGGFAEASRLYASRLDLTRVGFLGHSFGGGATPAMAHRGLVTEGWGTSAAFLFITAPWYSFEIANTNVALSNKTLAELPDLVRTIIQVYEEDDVNDHRMAIDLYENLTLPDAQIAYHNVLANDDYPTNHAVPASAITDDAVLDGLDQAAVWRPLDALIDASFGISTPEAAAELVLSVGPIPPYLDVPEMPTPVQAEGFYRFPWSSIQNLRD